MTLKPDTVLQVAVAILIGLLLPALGNAQSAPTSSNSGNQCGSSDQHFVDRDKINQQCAGSGVMATALLEGGVLFASNSHKLTENGVKAVHKLIKDLSAYQEILSIKIIGHTDSRGNDQYNQLLSERRAKYIAGYFSAALPQKRVTSVGLGESVPLVSNDTPAGRKINRRVEIQIIANGTH